VVPLSGVREEPKPRERVLEGVVSAAGSSPLIMALQASEAWLDAAVMALMASSTDVGARVSRKRFMAMFVR
jgi:hypothetical protein